jgi:hypothetical protein
MTKHKFNLIENDNINAFLRMYKKLAYFSLENEGFPLWWKIYNYILLQVEFKDGYISTSIIKKLSSHFLTSEGNIRRALKKLMENDLLLRYPYTAKRAKGYVINPEYIWYGDDESRQQKIAVYYKTMTKLQIKIDTTENEDIEVVLIDNNTGETVNTRWNKKM